jgi:hypothetical protein
MGFGSRGRRRLEVQTVKRRKHRVEVMTQVAMGKKTSAIVRSAVMQRASGVVSLPGYVTSVTTTKVRLAPELPPRESIRSADAARPRLNWVWKDPVAHPYRRKLVLEHKLMTRERIQVGDLPTKLLDRVLDYDKAVRWLNRLLRRSVSIGDGVRFHEPYSGIARWGDWVWAGIVSLAASELRSKSGIDELYTSVVSSVWAWVQAYTPLLDYWT